MGRSDRSADQRVSVPESRSAPIPTAFAPAERRTRREVRREAAKIAPADLVREALDRSPDAVTILNAERQIILCNSAFLRVAGKRNLDSALGQRPGEILDCIHAFETEGGCGTTESCAVCGAVQSILGSQRGMPDARECRITRRVNGHIQALDLLVSSSPSSVGDRFVIFAAIDISDEKRRRALEHIFLHDVLSTASAVDSLTCLVENAVPSGQALESVEMLKRTARRLLSQIQGQRELAAAEDGSLPVHPSAFGSVGILRDLIEEYSILPLARHCNLEIEGGSEDIPVVSDFVLLRRVLENLVRNALEASAPGEKVTLGCGETGGQVEFRVHNAAVMPRDVQLQVFQRSFSTKGTGRGLGTYSVRLLTERYLKGKVGFRSAAVEGTRFTVTVPKLLRARRRGANGHNADSRRIPVFEIPPAGGSRKSRPR